MIDLPRQQDLSPVRLLAVSDIDSDAVDTNDVAGIIEACGRCANAPAGVAIGPHNAKFGLLRARALRHAAGTFSERHPVFRVDQGANVLNRDVEGPRIDPENAVLAFIPAPLLADEIPIPRSHLTGGKGKATALLGLLELHIRSFKLCRAFHHMPFKIQIDLLERAGLAA